jgi:hypothetical protein
MGIGQLLADLDASVGYKYIPREKERFKYFPTVADFIFFTNLMTHVLFL